MRIFHYDNKFSRIMSRITDLVILHVLWCVFSIPIITIGASTTALYSITLKMVRDEESYILKNYVKAFRKNFKQSTQLWGIILIAVIWLAGITYVCGFSQNALLMVLGILNASLLVILILTVLYVFPLQARYENKIRNTIKNAGICAMRYFPYSILLLMVHFIPILITGFITPAFPYMIFYWLFFGSSGIALCSSFLLRRIFEKAELQKY